MCVAIISRSLTKAGMIRMFMRTARSLLRTEESIAAPGLVKAYAETLSTCLATSYSG